ncbi:MAG TPA: DUF4349 domain-containing protein [Terriglobia bacterium]
MTRSTHSVGPEELMAYLDGELPVERARQCAAHLEQCAECQTLAADLKSVNQQLNLWQVEAAPESVAGAVVPALESWRGLPKSKPGRGLTAGRWPQFRPWVWGLAGAVSALLVVTTLTTLHHQPSPAPSAALSAPAVGDQVAPASPVPPAPMPGEETQSLALKSPVGIASANRLLDRLSDRTSSSFSASDEPRSAQPGSMIARTASVTLVSKDFDQARSELDAVLRRHNGYAAQLTVDAPAGTGRSLTADLRIPASQLDAALAEIKKLGRVEQETQGGEEVTQQYMDLNARLSNARNTEQRLVEVLQQRTGKMADILAVENEIARVRGDIEQMEAERQGLEHRVAYAALQVQLKEEYKASLNLSVPPPSSAAQMKNSLVDGLRAATDSLLGLAQLLLYCGPVLLLWTLILFWPARVLWRRWRASPAAKSS